MGLGRGTEKRGAGLEGRGRPGGGPIRPRGERGGCAWRAATARAAGQAASATAALRGAGRLAACRRAGDGSEEAAVGAWREWRPVARRRSAGLRRRPGSLWARPRPWPGRCPGRWLIVGLRGGWAGLWHNDHEISSGILKIVPELCRNLHDAGGNNRKPKTAKSALPWDG